MQASATRAVAEATGAAAGRAAGGLGNLAVAGLGMGMAVVGMI